MYIHNMYVCIYVYSIHIFVSVYFNNTLLLPCRSRMYHLYELRTKLINECERAIYLSQSSGDQPSHRRWSTHTLAVVDRRRPTDVEKLPSIQSQGCSSANTTSVKRSLSGCSRSVLESPVCHRTTLDSPACHRTTLESVLKNVDIHKILGSVSK